MATPAAVVRITALALGCLVFGHARASAQQAADSIPTLYMDRAVFNYGQTNVSVTPAIRPSLVPAVPARGDGTRSLRLGLMTGFAGMVALDAKGGRPAVVASKASLAASTVLVVHFISKRHPKVGLVVAAALDAAYAGFLSKNMKHPH